MGSSSDFWVRVGDGDRFLAATFGVMETDRNRQPHGLEVVATLGVQDCIALPLWRL